MRIQERLIAPSSLHDSAFSDITWDKIGRPKQLLVWLFFHNLECIVPATNHTVPRDMLFRHQNPLIVTSWRDEGYFFDKVVLSYSNCHLFQQVKHLRLYFICENILTMVCIIIKVIYFCIILGNIISYIMHCGSAKIWNY